MFWGICIAFQTYLWTVIAGIVIVSIAYINFKSVWKTLHLIFLGVLAILLVDRLIHANYKLPKLFQNIEKLKYDMEEIKFIVLILLFVLALSLFLYLCYNYILQIRKDLRWDKGYFSRLQWGAISVLIIISLAIVVWSQIYLIARIRTFYARTYDMGIFSKMYHSMAKNGLPLTTVERDIQMSHFKVHVSPIVYLLLPIFKLFPYAETLQISQSVVTTLGLIPFLFLAKEFSLKPKHLAIWSVIFLLQPGFLLANLYDFHENIFLTPLVLFLIYFIKVASASGLFCTSVLLLMVKEDAAIYIISIAIFLFLASDDTYNLSGFKKRQSRIYAIII